MAPSNHAKKQRQRERAGKDVPEEDWKQAQAVIKQRKHHEKLQRAVNLPTPYDVDMGELVNEEPHLYDHLISGHAVADKGQKLLWNRAIWFNDIDKYHTFNRQEKQCWANCLLVEAARELGIAVPEVLSAYVVAVQERQGTYTDPNKPYKEREAFIESWQQAKSIDIVRVSNRELRNFQDGLRQLSSLAFEDRTTWTSNLDRNIARNAMVSQSGVADDDQRPAVIDRPALSGTANQKYRSISATDSDSEDSEDESTQNSTTGTATATDIVMHDYDPREFSVHGPEYEEHFAEAGPEWNAQAHSSHHTAWVDMTVAAMKEKVEFLKSQDPPDPVAIGQYLRKIANTEDAEQCRREIESWF